MRRPRSPQLTIETRPGRFQSGNQPGCAGHREGVDAVSRNSPRAHRSRKQTVEELGTAGSPVARPHRVSGRSWMPIDKSTTVASSHTPTTDESLADRCSRTLTIAPASIGARRHRPQAPPERDGACRPTVSAQPRTCAHPGTGGVQSAAPSCSRRRMRLLGKGFEERLHLPCGDGHEFVDVYVGGRLQYDCAGTSVDPSPCSGRHILR